MAAILESPSHSAIYRTAPQRDNDLLRGDASVKVVRLLEETTRRWSVLEAKARLLRAVEDHFEATPSLLSGERSFEMKVRIEMANEWMPLPYDFADDE